MLRFLASLALALLPALASAQYVWPSYGGSLGASVTPDEIDNAGATTGHPLLAASDGTTEFGTLAAGFVSIVDAGGDYAATTVEAAFAEVASWLDASGANDGDVFTADGLGGFAWEAPSGATDSAAIHDDVSGEIAALSSVTVASGDLLLVEDVDGGNGKAKVTAGAIAALAGGGGPEVQGRFVAQESIDASSAGLVHFTGVTFSSALSQYDNIHVRAGVKFTGKNATDSARITLWLGDAFVLETTYAEPTSVPGVVYFDVVVQVLSVTGTDTCNVYGTIWSDIASHNDGPVYAEAQGDFDGTDASPDMHLSITWGATSANNSADLLYFVATLYP